MAQLVSNDIPYIQRSELVEGSQIYVLCSSLINDSHRFYIGSTRHKPCVPAHIAKHNMHICYTRHIADSRKHKKTLLLKLSKNIMSPVEKHLNSNISQWIDNIQYADLIAVIDEYVDQYENIGMFENKHVDNTHTDTHQKPVKKLADQQEAYFEYHIYDNGRVISNCTPVKVDKRDIPKTGRKKLSNYRGLKRKNTDF